MDALSYIFLPPYNAPAAINNDNPPSIGIHGGGQHLGLPPAGGGGGAENKQEQLKKIVKMVVVNRICILLV